MAFDDENTIWRQQIAQRLHVHRIDCRKIGRRHRNDLLAGHVTASSVFTPVI